MAAVRQQINIAAGPRKVWRAFTTAEGLCSWWADEARVEAREGGRIVVTTEGDDGEPQEERGLFHVLRPTRRIEIAWDKNAKVPTAGTRIAVQVARDGDETRVSIVHSGTAVDEDEELRDTLDGDWRRALRALRSSLEG